MKETTSKTGANVAKKEGPFFSKGGKEGFFQPGQAQSFFAGGSGRQAVQTKLTVGQPNDVYEKEADAMADKVVRRKPIFESKAALPPEDDGGIRRKCAECEKEEQQQVQKKGEDNGSSEAPTDIESRLQSSKGSGSPLPSQTRQHMESSFGADFSGVRVHTGSSAVQMSRDLGAQAFTHGSDIYFNSGKYNTDSSAGKTLMAHELTHVVQQGHAAVPGVQKDNDPTPKASAGKAPPSVGMSASMSGLSFFPAADAKYKAGLKARQAFAMVLARMLGDQYKESIVDEMFPDLQSRGIGGQGTLAGSAGEGDPVQQFSIPVVESLGIVKLLEKRKLEVHLSEQQRQLLEYGVYSTQAWEMIKLPKIAHEMKMQLPKWYNEDIFRSELSARVGLLKKYINAMTLFMADKSSQNAKAVVEVLNEINSALAVSSSTLEAVRADSHLIAHEGYMLLWPPDKKPGATKDAKPAPVMAPPTKSPDYLPAVSFLSFLGSQQELATQAAAPQNVTARKSLLDRWVRFFDRSLSVGEGDQKVTDTPGTANMEGYQSNMTVSPPLGGAVAGMQLEANLESDYRFIMSLLFPTVFDAFMNFSYDWSYVRVPDDKIGKPVDTDKMEQQKASAGDVVANRFNRAGKYAVEDVQNVFRELGPFGVGATDLVTANAILRFVGTGIKVALEYLTKPASEEIILFPGPGLYMVRCRALPVTHEHDELKRTPSVAYQPVIVREPEALIADRTNRDASSRDKQFQRMLELRRLLSQPVCYADEDGMRKELATLEKTLGSVGSSLEEQKKNLEKALQDPALNEEQGRAIQKQLDTLEEVIKLRGDRGKGKNMAAAVPLVANFIGDTGQSIRLTMEAISEGESDDKQQYWVSDLTTPKSSQATGSGKTKAEAIVSAMKQILEGQGGYGRGYASISVDNVTYTLRITSSLGNLFMEAIENVTTALSIALVVAAPFTGGASLALLLPVGLVGAIPSAYRLINRAIDDTLHFDMATVMDVVNIVGGIVGLGQAVTPLTMVRTGKALYIMGVGLDALGILMIPASVVGQILALEGLSPGEKAARILEILGQAMMNVGIMVGASLAHEHAQSERETAQNLHENQLLEQSRKVEEMPNDEQVMAELNAASEGEIKKSSVEGYDIEIELTNGHTWRRRKDGKGWCRFTVKKCGTGDFNEKFSEPIDKIESKIPKELDKAVAPPEKKGTLEERAMEESMKRWEGKETETSFARHKQRFKSLAATLRNKLQALRKSGTRHDEAIRSEVLEWPVDAFIETTPALKKRWYEMKQEARQQENWGLIKEMDNFFKGEKGQGAGNVANREPDLVEFDLANNEILVTDWTADPFGKMHNFKTAFYVEVFRAMLGEGSPIKVRGRDVNPDRGFEKKIE